MGGFPKYVNTRAGSKVVITDYIKGTARPYIGYYISEGERYPCTWLEDGYYNEKTQRALDLTLQE